MRIRVKLFTVVTAAFVSVPLAAQTPSGWKAHDPDRPQPPAVTPGATLGFAAPPSDALVLFDGTDLSQWRANADGGPAEWKVADGAMETVPGKGPIRTVRAFGDVQLHVEWSSPGEVFGEGQGRGNSGVYLMGVYEVQVLDSYENTTYPDGQAAAVYGQYPPLVNASAPPGKWQSYDVVFRRPRFDAGASLLAPARMTVFHNGVLVQDSVELLGPTNWLRHRAYKSHPSRLPLVLQDHANPVRFRNLWVRELDEREDPGPPHDTRPVLVLDAETGGAYVGLYQSETRTIGDISFDAGYLWLDLFGWGQVHRLVAHSATEFSLPWTAGKILFELDEEGRATAVTLSLAGAELRGERVP